MTKSIKKILLILATVILTVVLAACGSNNSGGSNGESSAPKTPTSKEIIEKYTEVAKNIKSSKFNGDVTMTNIIDGKESKVTMKIDGTSTVDPLDMLVTYNISNGTKSQKVIAYLKNGESLYMSKDNVVWEKLELNSQTKKQIDSIKQVNGNQKALDFYKDNADSFKVEEQGDNYVLTYTGTDQKFKELLEKLSSSSGTSVNYGDVDFKNMFVKVTVKKSNYEPVYTELSTELVNKNNSSASAKIEIKQAVSEINTAKVEAPVGIK